MQVVAKLRHARISPQKCRLVADQIRGETVGECAEDSRVQPQEGGAHAAQGARVGHCQCRAQPRCRHATCSRSRTGGQGGPPRRAPSLVSPRGRLGPAPPRGTHSTSCSATPAVARPAVVEIVLRATHCVRHEQLMARRAACASHGSQQPTSLFCGPRGEEQRLDG